MQRTAVRLGWFGAFAGFVVLGVPHAHAQPANGAAANVMRGSAAMTPVNDLPNPYKTVEGWAKLDGGRAWGSTSAVAVDKDGSSIWVAERCSANSCATSSLDPIMKFDRTGKLVTSFGSGMLMSPHGIEVDAAGNVWVTDCSCTGGRVADTSSTKRGHQIFKFSPTGTLLMTLGTAGGAKGSGYFYQPNDILVAPNGDLFVVDGHSSADTANARVMHFDAKGTLVRQWGVRGAGVGQMDQPHALAMDSRGRLFVADRGNNRLLIYRTDGTLLDTWYQFSRISGLFIDKNDVLYAADSESGSVSPPHSAWKRGIRIGSARDGTVTAFIPDPAVNPPSTSSAEGITVDAAGNIYGAEVGQRAIKRYERK